MAIIGGWEQLGEPIGEGGQGHVYLVRKPSRVDERKAAVEDLRPSHYTKIITFTGTLSRATFSLKMMGSYWAT